MSAPADPDEPTDEQAEHAAYRRGIEDGKLLEAALQRHAAAPQQADLIGPHGTIVWRATPPGGQPPAAPQQAEPVAWRHDHGEDAGGFEYYEGASCPDCQPLYLHPPAAEVQRLRDAARDVCEWADAAQWALGNETGVPAAKLDALRRALEGGE